MSAIVINQAFVKIIVAFAEGVDTSNIKFGSIVIKDNTNGATHLLSLVSLIEVPERGVFEGKFKPQMGVADTFADLGHEIQYNLDPRVLQFPESMDAKMYIETATGDKPKSMKIMLDLHAVLSLNASDEAIKFLPVTFMKNSK